MKWQESWEPVCACVFVYDNVSVFMCVEGDVCKECMNNCVCVCVCTLVGVTWMEGQPKFYLRVFPLRCNVGSGLVLARRHSHLTCREGLLASSRHRLLG